MEGQEDMDSYYEENGSTNGDQASKDDSVIASALKKNNLQLNFIKDRISGMYKCQMCSYKSMRNTKFVSSVSPSWFFTSALR